MESIYFQAFISELEHPLLHEYLGREYKGKDKVRGLAKKFVCDAAENALKQRETQAEETQEHQELLERLEEIKRLLESGTVVMNAEQPAEPPKHSQKVSERLKILGL